MWKVRAWLTVATALLATAATALAAEVEEDATGKPCSCVPCYQCKSEQDHNAHGTGLIDIHGGSPREPCEDSLDVCCKESDVLVLPPVKARKPGVCGRRNAEDLLRCIPGKTDDYSQFGEFPWMAAILREDRAQGESSTSYVCGGALIHPQIVLTAAHCVNKLRSDRLWTRLGEWDTQTLKEPLPHQERLVGKVVVHPDFRNRTLHNDVALLFLETAVDPADNVDVVCLPPQDAVFDRRKCFNTGWGKDVFGKDGRYQVILKKVELPMVPRDECLEKLRETRLGKGFVLHESFVCAGGDPDKDTCRGDGGSPLVCPMEGDPTRYVQAGILAWGIGCGGPTPAVYASVAKFRDWIDQQVLYANLNATYVA